MTLHDITPLVSERLAVFPGDVPPSRMVVMDMAAGDSVTVSTLRTTVHVGAHADAPSHYGREGRTIDAQPLDPYLGRCRLVRVEAGPGAVLGPEDLPGTTWADDRPSRLLIATGSYPDPGTWRDDFVALAPDLVDRIARAGYRLVGVDTPSVDPASSKELPAHARCLVHDLAILEGIVLSGVEAGDWELIALPLKLAEFDASPVRAVLRSI